MSTATAHTSVESFLSSLAADSAQAVQKPRVIAKHIVGKHVRQGDIYICCVPDAHAHGLETKNRQLALGNSQGSRHIAEGNVTVFAGSTAPSFIRKDAIATLLGPCVTSKEGFVISHPEHAHIHLPAGTYQILHQLDPRTMQAVKD
jgi:hypothetical protein